MTGKPDDFETLPDRSFVMHFSFYRELWEHATTCPRCGSKESVQLYSDGSAQCGECRWEGKR